MSSNPNVWFAVPSARPVEEAAGCLLEWHRMGYKLAVWRDQRDALSTTLEAAGAGTVVLVGPYPGYAQAVNALAKDIIATDPDADWIVTAGDDTQPDLNHRSVDIAHECTAHFGGTFGVMQPTGDRWADGSIDRIAGSPWMGREWCERGNRGAGPFHPQFEHMFGDQVLQETCQKLGIYWQRRDLIHLHKHWTREGPDANHRKPKPAHLEKWTSTEHWDLSQKAYERLKNAGFAECMPVGG